MNAQTDPSAIAEANPTASLNAQFKKVRNAAIASESAEDVAGYKLNDALSALYEFGENVLGSTTAPDEDTYLLFLKSNDVKINAVKRRNPYVALTQLAFVTSSPSLRSQRAKVLAFARQTCVPVSDFGQWIDEEGGLKGRLKEAVKFFSGTAHTNNERERASRLDRAKDYLNHLPSLADFNIAGLPDGFAIVLARVVDGQAQAVNVLAHETHEIAKLEAAITPFDPAGPARRRLLSTLPLGQLWRAIDAIFLATAPKQQAHVRSIAIRNTLRGIEPICEVLSVSAARDEATAVVEIAGHIGALPLDEYFILYSAVKEKEAGYGFDCAAELFHSAFAEHHNWNLQGTALSADDLSFPITLTQLPPSHSFRVADRLAATAKTFSVTQDGAKALMAYIDAEATKTAPTRGAKQAVSLPELMEMEDANGEFHLRCIGSADDVVIGTTTHALEPEIRDLAYADMLRLAKAMVAYEVDADGCFMDGQTDDACAEFVITLDTDKLTVTIPTRSGEARSRFRVPLEAA